MVLLAMLDGFMRECLSPDSAYLSIARGKDSARRAGVPEEEIERIAAILREQHARRRGENPLSGMF